MFYHRALITCHPSSAATKQSGELSNDVITKILFAVWRLIIHLFWLCMYLKTHVFSSLKIKQRQRRGFECVCLCVYL